MNAFSLLEDAEITADMAGSISASYAGTDPNNSQTAESNTWALSLQDTGEIARTYTGDQRGPIRVNLATGVESYDWSPTSWANDGTLIGGEVEPDFADVIYASSGNDKIDGKGGNDALSGGAGNDQIDGGEGADMIAGGAGSDSILGGAGNDFISSSAGLLVPQRLRANDSHYKFGSCSCPYLLTKTLIRYPKTTQKASPDACASHGRTRSCIKNTPNSIAACARKQVVVAAFNRVDRRKKDQNQARTANLTSLRANFLFHADMAHSVALIGRLS